MPQAPTGGERVGSQFVLPGTADRRVGGGWAACPRRTRTGEAAFSKECEMYTVKGRSGECGHEHPSIDDSRDCYVYLLLTCSHRNGEADPTIQIRRSDGTPLNASEWLAVDDALRESKLAKRAGRPLSPLTLKQLDSLKSEIDRRMHHRVLLRRGT